MIIVTQRKTLILIVLSVLIISLSVALAIDREENLSLSAFSSEDGKHIVLIDAGHGGIDGGAVGIGGIVEKELNLDVAKKLEEILVKNNYFPVMTRISDVSLYDASDTSIKNKKRADLKNRLRLMKSSGAEIFVSIHMNNYSEGKYRGGQVFYGKNNENSRLLGESIQNRIKKELPASQNREAKKSERGIYLLKNAEIPAVIVECGFLSNKDDVELLKTAQYRQKVANTIYNGICDYFKNIA